MASDADFTIIEGYKELQDKYGIIGRSPALNVIFDTIQRVAPTDMTVLIIGESGTGKELIAKAIHEESHRKDKPLFTINCGAIPVGILESELFGHKKGAFTGAVGERKGYFELADKGTLFLDEIGETPVETQVRLLRTLESGEFIPVGGTEIKKADVRVIAATNRNLLEEVRAGKFRKDLFYRLKSISIELPGLRQRMEDIRLLADKFIRDYCEAYNVEFEGFTEDALNLMEQYHWPGNIRELKNLVESLITLHRGKRIDSAHIIPHLEVPYESEENRLLPVPMSKTAEQAERELIYRTLLSLKKDTEDIKEMLSKRPISFSKPNVFEGKYSFVDDINETDESLAGKVNTGEATLLEMERFIIEQTLQRFRGNRRKAAESLGISERTLYRKINEYEL